MNFDSFLYIIYFKFIYEYISKNIKKLIYSNKIF